MANLKFQEVKEPYKTKDKQGCIDKDEENIEYVCVGRNKFGIGTYKVRKVNAGAFSK